VKNVKDWTCWQVLIYCCDGLVLLNAGEEPETNRVSETQPESSSYQVESTPVVDSETKTWPLTRILAKLSHGSAELILEPEGDFDKGVI